MNSQRPLLSIQAPSAVVMIRPHHFTVNTETAVDNAFQNNVTANSSDAKFAYDEITKAANILITHGVRVHMFEDEGKQTPDSVFPNNWFSTHSGGHVAVYPMKPENRRLERRSDIIEMLKKKYRVQDVTDYSGLEQDDLFLEGTGAMVLDHMARVAYAVESDRTNPIILERFCTHFNFEPMVFKASDEEGTAIYHTNVLMCIGTDYALIGLDMIEDQDRRDEIATRLENSGKRVIALTNDQIRNFAGNAIELQGQDGRLLALSQTAYDALNKEQISMLETSVKLVTLEIPTIEKAGGSVRCTLAGIHLASRR
ncbi:citrulline utilization hydrolase CtlX [Curvivirga aplysinae]|uniref:citrulline utilization hydrolase CtlX n=1 Tax=Curvivirga aplysinae TaxID=2529852 RepID=UPI0012BCAFC6|nr:arginine deiminase-related protein [Curvivirga aplysinae]MTI10087.1 amidinotransferase [Curvivirga aplysinae]